MSLKAQIIALLIVLVIIVTSVICVYVYIGHLNSTIAEMSTTIANQANEIDSLKCSIDSLNKEIESLDNVIAVTDDYITSINQIKDEDSSIKQEIYEQVINNEEVKDWFSETLPDDLLSIINSDAYIGLCEDGY